MADRETQTGAVERRAGIGDSDVNPRAGGKARSVGADAAEAPIDVLAHSIRDRRALLFVGAGLSMSVGLPSWQVLMERIADELGLDRESVLSPECSYQALAEYYRLRRGGLKPLCAWMERHWAVSRESVERSRLHELIVQLGFPMIYTTNYDANLETAFEVRGRPFVKVVDARDVAIADQTATQIVKFHGDFASEASLVLAESDYFNRLSFESPLDVKFRADALGRTVLFIGYSMSDMNIRLLLYRLWETWNRSGHEADRPRSFVFMPRPNPVQEAVLGRWGIDVLTGPSDDPEQALSAFLSDLKSRVDEL